MDNEPKKGMHPLVWVGLGCGCLVLLIVGFLVAGTGFIAFKAKDAIEDFQENPEEATAKLIAFANPDIDLVGTDKEEGTVTFRSTKDGKEFTVKYEDLKDGNLTIQGPDGEITFDASETADGASLTIQGPDGETHFGGGQGLDDVPSWVPLYPDATSSQATFSTSGSQGETGILAIETDQSTEKVKEYYKERLADEGYKVTDQTTNLGDGGMHATVSGTKEGQTVNVVITRQKGETTIILQYNRKAS